MSERFAFLAGRGHLGVSFSQLELLVRRILIQVLLCIVVFRQSDYVLISWVVLLISKITFAFSAAGRSRRFIRNAAALVFSLGAD